MRLKMLSPAVVMVVLTMAASACGYALAGRGNTLPPGIATIGIPAFINQSVVGGIDRVITEAVTVEFQSKGKYRVLPQAEGVDAVLTGRVVSVILQPVAFTTSNQVSRWAIVATAAIEFRQVGTDHIIWANPSFQVRDEYDATTGTAATADVNALLTNDTRALDRLSRTFARSVVTSVFEAF